MYVKTVETVHFKYAQFIILQLYLSIKLEGGGDKHEKKKQTSGNRLQTKMQSFPLSFTAQKSVANFPLSAHHHSSRTKQNLPYFLIQIFCTHSYMEMGSGVQSKMNLGI